MTSDNSGNVSDTRTLTSTDMLSTNANNKVNSVTASSSSISVGQVVTVTGDFGLGNIGALGDAWLQPVGSLAFDPTVFRLISAQVTLDGILQTQDDLYFTGLNGQVSGQVVYTLQGKSEGATSLDPYQIAASGQSNRQYTINFGEFSASVTDTAFEGTVDLTVSPSTGATPSETLTYTMTVGNSGDQTLGDPGSGNGVIVTADIPTNTTYVAGSVVATTDFSVQWSTDNEATWVDTEPSADAVTDVRWVLTSALPANNLTAVSDTLGVTVDDCVSTGTSITNNASIGVGSATGLASAQVTATTGNPSTNLSVAKSDTPDPVVLGNNLTYTVTATNNGPCSSPSVTVTDTLPGNVAFVSSTPSQGTCSGTSTVTCPLGTLASGDSETVTIVVTPTLTGTLSNSASVADRQTTDSSTGDNSASESTTVNPGALTLTNVQPESLVAGATGKVDVSFTIANPLSGDGKILVTFPAGFTLDSGESTAIGSDPTSFDGNVSVSVSGDSVTITRSGGSQLGTGTAVTLELTNIKNPQVSGSTGTYTIKTTTASDLAFDQDTAVTADTITPGVLTATNVEPESLGAGVAGNVDISFTTTNPLSGDGKIVVTFPSGFTPSSGGATEIGAETVSVSGQNVTITRSNGSQVGTGTAVTLELTNVGNPTDTGDTGTYSIKTTNASDATIDEDTAVTGDTIVGDGTAPTVTVEQAAGQSDPTNDSPINFTATFSEDVTGFSSGDVTLAGTANATTVVVTGGAATYTITVSGMTGDGTVITSIGAGVASDAAGNVNLASTSTDNTVTYDTTSPTVALTYSPDRAVSSADELTITATFNEAIAGTPTIAINTTGTDLSATNMTDSGDQTTWTFSDDVPATSDGTATVTISGAIDAAGNTADAASNNTFTIDNTGPTVALTYNPDRAVNSADELTITATFNEAIAGTPTIAINTTGTDLSATNMTDSGDQTTWTFSYDVPATSDGPATVTIAGATDAVGNSNDPASNNSFTIDNTGPTVAVTYDPDRTVSSADELTITATFNGAIVGTPTIANRHHGH